MQVYIKTPRNNTISLHVDSTYSISKVKKILCDREGIPITEQRIIYAGKQLEDTKTLAYYAIQRESTLYLMTRLRGGGAAVTFNDDFTLTISDSGLLFAQVTGTLNTNLDGTNFSLINRLSFTTEEVVPASVAGRGFADNYDGISVFQISFTINVTQNEFVSYYKQLMRFAFYIKYSPSPEETVFTNTIVKYLFIPNTPSNIQMSGNKIKMVTVADISSKNKSVILPPVTTRTPVMHFKVTSVTVPYIFQIIPYFTLPTIYTLYDTFPTFDSMIDVISQQQLYLDGLNRAISLVSDGTNWTVVNNYSDTLTVTTTVGEFTLPPPFLSESSEKVAVQYEYTGSDNPQENLNNMILYAMTSSYLKYIFLKNSSGSSLNFTLYFPRGAAVDHNNGSDLEYNTVTLTIPTTRAAGLIITFLNGRYYIISAGVIPTYFQAGGYETPTITLTKTVNFIESATRVYMPSITTSNSFCKLLVLKARGVTNTILVAQGTGVFIMDSTYTAISMDTTSVLWFIINVNNDISAYLPICYYLGSGVMFVVYENLF